ncbi:MAG TPA: hypothetical protein VHN14_05255 [Kofleriaceae bacterium]|jgi:hypothetical protein|nr:hypothetical protein [Kofleriaceae bacterium]
MTIMVLDHQHDPALTLHGVRQQLMFQTGTLVVELRNPAMAIGVAIGEGFVRDQLQHAVLELPPDSPGHGVQAIASAAPASVLYAPPPAGIRAEEPIGGFGTIADFPVTWSAFRAASVAIPPGGWAVDRTGAVRSGNQIQLSIDLAVAGPSTLLRLAYSLLVAIPTRFPSDVISDHLHGHLP